MTEHELPSWAMPIDPAAAGAPAMRSLIESMHRDLMRQYADRLGQMTAASSWQMLPGDCDVPDDGICTVTRTAIRCVNTRSWHVWAGCTQEHLVEGWMCQPCTDEIEQGAGTRWCASCRSYNQAELAKPEPERKPLVSDAWMIIRKVAA